MFVTFFNDPFYDTPNYQILDTDYDNYTIVYACHEDDMQYLWLMTRYPEPSDELLDQMKAKAASMLPNFVWDNEIRDT